VDVSLKEKIFEQVDRIMASGKVDAIDINSGAMARVGMDALMTAGALEARGIETVPHLTTRDYNIIGLQAMLLGAWTVGGVRNVLAITGDPPSVGDYPEASGVYEVDSVGLVKILHRLNQGTDWAGKTSRRRHEISPSGRGESVADDLDAEIERFHAKKSKPRALRHDPANLRSRTLVCLREEAGRQAHDSGADRHLAAEQLQASPAPQQRGPRHRHPEPVLKSMEAAGAAARERGFEVAREMLAWSRTELAGAYLIPPFKRYEEILDIL
jgi:homocysteine S-methyltransferase